MEKQPLDWFFELLSFSLLLGFGYVLYYLPSLPEEVPIHLNGRGEVDGWGSPWVMLMLPVIGLGVWIIMTLVQRSPENFNYPVKITEENKAYQYALSLRFMRFIKASIMVLFAFICKGMVDLALTGSTYFGNWLLIVILGVLLSSIGLYIWLARRNA